jgi:hypothetical protein
MPTGACGINCDVCQLNLLGHCSSCGPGKSELATRKSAAQQRILGHPCAILECARLNHIDYCPRDCPSFPCDNFSNSTYPYGRAFLDMQQRRRRQGPPPVDPSGRPVEIDPAWWNGLASRDMAQVAGFTLAGFDSGSDTLEFTFLNRDVRVNTRERCLQEKVDEAWVTLASPLLELVVLDYLKRVTCLQPLGREMVATDDLADAGYFTGANRLKKAALLSRYGGDPEGFKAAGRFLGGNVETMADAAIRLDPFPRIPVYYLLWLGNHEFPPRLSILFDRSIETLISSPAIWSLVTLCTYYLIRGNVEKHEN